MGLILSRYGAFYFMYVLLMSAVNANKGQPSTYNELYLAFKFPVTIYYRHKMVISEIIGIARVWRVVGAESVALWRIWG